MSVFQDLQLDRSTKEHIDLFAGGDHEKIHSLFQ